MPLSKSVQSSNIEPLLVHLLILKIVRAGARICVRAEIRWEIATRQERKNKDVGFRRAEAGPGKIMAYNLQRN
jgi:hypothetical protein